LILADGFSCREQIRQGSDRTALHLAEALQMALHDGPGGPTAGRPELAYREDQPATLTVRQCAAGAIAAFVTAAAVARLKRRGPASP
jgi:hypothetical protein